MSQSDIRHVVQILLSNNLQTLEYYFENEDLMYERTILHNNIIDEILKRKKYSRGKKAFMLGGAPANGKSSFLESLYCDYPETALKIDPDEIKLKLPEYELMIQRKEPLAAVIVHEESSLIAKKLKYKAMIEGTDLILDGIANDTLKKREEVFTELEKYNYHVRMDYVSLDSELSIIIAKKRAAETGREVPESYVKAMNIAIAELVPKIIEHQYFHELYLWDTNHPQKPVLILQVKNSKLDVLREDLYEKFKSKSHEQSQA